MSHYYYYYYYYYYYFVERCRHNTTFLLPRKRLISVKKISRAMIMVTVAAYFSKQQKTLNTACRRSVEFMSVISGFS